MKLAHVAVLIVVAAAALALLANKAEATSTCGHGTGSTGNWCEGYSHVSTTTGGISSARCWAVIFATSTPATPTCTTSGITPSAQSAWQLEPGECKTLYFFETTTGASPPAAPNKGVLSVAVDTSGTAPRVYKDGTTGFDASGTSYQFCATSDGTSTGSARAGTLRIFVRAIKDNGAGGVGNYNVNTDGVATVGTVNGYDTGIIRGKMRVASIASSAPAAGSIYAYGPAGDESITITSTFTPPFGDVNVETMRNNVVDEATLSVGASGSTVDVDSGGLVQSFTPDSTFPYANNPYVGALTIRGSSVRTGQAWAVFSATGHGSNIVVFSDLVAYDSTDDTIDPRIVFDSDGAGTFATADDTWPAYVGSSCTGTPVLVFNKGETFCSAGYVFNARAEKLTRAMTLGREDATAAACVTASSSTPSAGGLFTRTATLATSAVCATTADATGAPRYFRMTNTDQDHRSGLIFGVSSLYYVDSHPESDAILSTDNFPTQDASENLLYYVMDDGAGNDASETIHSWCHVVNVRKDANIDTSGSALTQTIVDPASATRATRTTDTDSAGWTTTSQNLLATTPLGDDWAANCSVSFNGNTGTDSEAITIAIPAAGAGDTFTGDPLKIFGGDAAIAGETVRLAVSEAYLDGTARTGNAAGTFIRILNPANALVVTDATPTEVSHGVYRYDWTAPSTPGPYLVLARTTDPDSGDPVGTANIVYVRNATLASDNDTVEQQILAEVSAHRDNSMEIFGMSFNNLDFDGFLFLLLWFVVLIFCLVRSRVFAGFVATLGLLDVLIPDIMPGSSLFYFFLLVLAVWLEAIAGEKIYAKWLNKKPQGEP